MDLEKAALICKTIAEDRTRWGRHAGFTSYAQHEVLDALVAIHDAGLFESVGKHEEVVLANRQRAAAEARASKYKKQLDELKAVNESISAQVVATKEEKKKGFFS